ncbi:YncE family protein [Edaphobacter aggregans]|uniref:YncE family protein n=1 Tax=Edaphobacter aggregans TaxID=570835 RepID=UPI000553E3CA|nr:PQQ-binding-like beta-propeller repeat protein [Edaphobacter aggregans]
MKSISAILAVAACMSVPLHAAEYKVKTRYPIVGTEGWDYITVDSGARRIYVSHGVRVNVLNADTGAPVGTIEDTPGVHGIAIASRQKHGFTSNGKENKVSMFDTTTLAVIKKIEVGRGPDGIYYDEASNRVFTNNHGSHDITAIDGSSGDVVGTVTVGGDGEGAVTGKDGLVYVALEDKDEIAAFDPRTLEVKRHLPLENIKAPTGLAVDVKNKRLFVGGHSKTVAIIDADSGKQIASFPTGSGTDAAGFDPSARRIFVSNGEGNLTVIQQHSANEYEPLETVTTQPSAKTMAFDTKTGQVFLSAASVTTTPAVEAGAKPTKTIREGSFCVLVVGQ